MEKKNETKRLSKEDVYDYLGDKTWHTTGEMAKEFEVSNPTVGNRIKKLVSDGLGILAGPNGYKLTEKEDVDNEEAAREIEKMSRRMIAIVMRQALVAKPMKILTKEAVKLLPKDPRERAIVRKYIVQLTHLIDFQELEDEE